MLESNTLLCRFCGRVAAFAFKKTMLRRYQVSYFRCESCGSIETERPYWLDEAYAIPGVHIDVGIASRSIKNWIALAVFFSQIGLDREALIVDFGAASGLVARLMRDLGYNMRSYDKYSSPSFTNYFNATHPERSRPRVVCAFEVFEHFTEPATELGAVLSSRPDFVIFTTWFCDDQPEDWIYFAEACGQHVFFYTERAMREFADRAGYDLVLTSYFHILARRNLSPATLAGLEKFRLQSQELVHEHVACLFKKIEFGNAYIDADFETALRLFDRELDERKLSDRSSLVTIG